MNWIIKALKPYTTSGDGADVSPLQRPAYGVAQSSSTKFNSIILAINDAGGTLKKDISAVSDSFKRDIASVGDSFKRDITIVGDSIKQDISIMGESMHGRIDTIREDLDGRLDTVEERLETHFAELDHGIAEIDHTFRIEVAGSLTGITQELNTLLYKENEVHEEVLKAINDKKKEIMAYTDKVVTGPDPGADLKLLSESTTDDETGDETTRLR